ncbi:PilN domain-containing protein [Pseudomonas weihenstephanensis]|uniref:Pilus assembly protein PilN n=1 Tax=Pseudomonas weihenstephanensis TaxID=1608994 RepID=A0A0J6IGA6_9PSED|nr:PilN domain-containing protein [Pseudomonas weihenstephanensis]KMN13645.1 pilus assembly protein PilN [Pseudomonas weihenstephanensis]KMN19055.1 pilus assembly protein PilN [Pseudomonas weihenstephanensis]MBM1192182.1 pilus assembly protein PilN [Pseudomonas weihenstephanensis]GLX90104.1 pilus assembly protein PilN [Pseudomonas fragi]
MAGINLLPWREWLREKRRKRYVMVLVALLAVAAAGLYALDHFVDRAVERQLARNDLIRSAMVQLDGRAQQIDQLKVRREQLLERMQTIETLQGNRSGSSIVFDQLARSLPGGVYFTDVKMAERTIAITGVAQSNALVAELMRNLDASHWLEAPALIEVKAGIEKDGSHTRLFQMTVHQSQNAHDGSQF